MKGYDEPENLPSSLSQFCLIGADAGHCLFGALLLGMDSVVGLIFNIPFDRRLLLIVLSFGFGTFALVGVAVNRAGASSLTSP